MMVTVRTAMAQAATLYRQRGVPAATTTASMP